MIYFSDLAGNHRGRRGLTVAFGPDDANLFQSIEHLSSARLRKLIGVESFDDLERAAQDARININHFCKIRLSEHVSSGLLTDEGRSKTSSRLHSQVASEGDQAIGEKTTAEWLDWAKDRAAELDPFAEGLAGLFRDVQRP